MTPESELGNVHKGRPTILGHFGHTYLPMSYVFYTMPITLVRFLLRYLPTPQLDVPYERSSWKKLTLKVRILQFLKTFTHLTTSLKIFSIGKFFILRPNDLYNRMSQGRLISKMSVLYLQFSQNISKVIQLYYYGTSSRIVFVCFLGELKTPKRHFEIN